MLFRSAFIPFTMTREEIQNLRQIAFRKFYLRPSFMLKKLLDIRTINDARAVMKSARSLFWLALRSGLFSRRTKRLHTKGRSTL